MRCALSETVRQRTSRWAAEGRREDRGHWIVGVGWVLGAAVGAFTDPGNRALFLGYGFAGVLTIALLVGGRRRRRRPSA